MNPKIDLVPICSHVHSHTQPQTTNNLPSVSIDLLFMDNSYKWNHIKCDILHLPFDGFFDGDFSMTVKVFVENDSPNL